MRISILIIVLTSLIYFDASAQSMSWVSSRYTQDAACQDKSDCTKNLMCYKLKYVPSEDGVLTSYTTSFIVNCNDRVSAIKSNESCTMTDKSQEVFACDSEGLILLHSSGNLGDIEVKGGEPVYLHQICIQMNRPSDEVVFHKADIADLTANVKTESGVAKTDFIDYQPFTFMNSLSQCLEQDDYLTLSGELNGEVAELSWEPTKEARGGVYTLYQKVNDEEFIPVETFEARMVNQANAFKYTYELPLEEYGNHLFKVEYVDNGGELNSNLAEIYFRDLRFSMSVSPNPTADYIKLFVNSADSDVELRITNMDGKIIIRKSIKTDQEVIQDLRDLRAGMYNVSVFSQDDQITEKVILIN